MGRTVIVGDVHGCASELEELLGRVALGRDDQLVFVGDLVARGPRSARVLALFREQGALGVRGNHDERLIRAREARTRRERGPRLSPHHAALVDELASEDWQTLAALPLHLDLREHAVRIVHAGVVPGLPIDQQDPWVLMNMRSLDAMGKASAKLGAASWAAGYSGPPHVVFGHDARRELQIHRWATGLDTGCVYGKALSALVLGAGESVPDDSVRRDAIVSVAAHEAYYRPS